MEKTEPVLIGSIINNIMKDSAAFSKGMLEAKVMNAWYEVVGKDLSDATQKLTLRDGKLYVSFNSASARSEFFARRNDIKYRLNGVAGRVVVKFIVVS
ncbi:MAG: DUF721 domain-containing protein [Rikenellaceae bacterium]